MAPGRRLSVAGVSSKHNGIQMKRGKAQVVINKENDSGSGNESWWNREGARAVVRDALEQGRPAGSRDFRQADLAPVQVTQRGFPQAPWPRSLQSLLL